MAESVTPLEALASEAFEIEVGFTLPAVAMRSKLLSLPVVKQVMISLNHGAVSENTIRQFVATLMTEFRPQHRFPYDLALAALAVVLERRPTDFADEFLCYLARLRLAEMPVSIRVARACLTHRVRSVARNQYRVDPYEQPTDPPLREMYKPVRPQRRVNARRRKVPQHEYNGATHADA